MVTRPENARGVILVVEDDATTSIVVTAALKKAGYEVLRAVNGVEALERVAEFPPDLIVSDISMPGLEGVAFLRALRADIKTNALPFIFLSSHAATEDIVAAFEAGADDYIVKSARPAEIVARVRAKLDRPPVPRAEISRDSRSGLLSERAFAAASEIEIERAGRERRDATIAYLALFELAEIRRRFGQRGETQIARDIAKLLDDRLTGSALAGRDAEGRFTLMLGGTGVETRKLLDDLSQTVAASTFTIGAEAVRLTPIVGFATRTGAGDFPEVDRRARVALAAAASHLDLRAVRYTANLEQTIAAPGPKTRAARVAETLTRLRAPFQIASMLVGGLVVPFAVYTLLAAHGFDITKAVYLLCVFALVFTGLGIWLECILAVPATEPPQATSYPKASAIIAAYLPNEATTLVETIETFLRVQYAGDVQIVLAYNTPRTLPIEEELRAIAQRDPRFVALRVDGSTSKAQNVNAALRIVEGEFVGLFDADHKPDPDSFTRAWNWLANGYDVVQGHCVIRNGDESFVARLVAIEFEGIYAVSHPGRARLHGFGVFGGSNGYWKTELLRQTRMHGSMLTEDIDSSLRVVEAGYRIANDRNLVSRELAPVTFRAFWNQRMRWAQGWFQVTLAHVVPAMLSRRLTVRQKFGMLHLLLWRELYVWIVLQIFPVLAFWIFVRHDTLDWFVPFFVATTIFTTLTGPVQVVFSYALADRSLKLRRKWFFAYLFYSLVYFSELKNVISRMAQLKEMMRERAWKVTPRTSAVVE